MRVKEVFKAMIPKQTIFVSDVVKFHNDRPIGVIFKTYTKYMANMVSIKYIQDGEVVIFHFVDASGCKLIGRNYKENKS